MHETTIGQKEQAEKNKEARTKNMIAADEPAMRTRATNGGAKLLHN